MVVLSLLLLCGGALCVVVVVVVVDDELRMMMIRPKIRAKSNDELEKAERVHIAPRTLRPLLN